MSILDEWEEVAKKSTKVVLWYPHLYDGTIRGPFHRWFKCELGDDQSDKFPSNKGVISSVEDDTEFAALAMNKFQTLIDLVRQKDEALKFYGRAEQILSGSDYQNAATSSYRHHTDDGGDKAREAIALMESLK